MDQNLKLSDFDHRMKIREDISMLTKLYRRLLHIEDNKGANTYSIAGA
jgi:hypothetical protein